MTRRRRALRVPWFVPWLALAVLALHLWLADDVLRMQAGLGDAASPTTRLRRIEVSFVHELQQAAPPAVAPRAPRRRARRAPAAAPPLLAAASAPRAPAPSTPAAVAASAPASEPAPAPEPAASAAELLAANDAASAPPTPASAASAASAMAAELPAPDAVASAPSAAAAASMASVPSAAAAFEWPPSTRLSYTLNGYYRGPVEGQAQVEWVRSGTRYQVHLDVSIGPYFAPIAGRHLMSDGELTEQGLQPHLYDEETRIALRAPRHATVTLDADVIRLANGKLVPRPQGVQDAASQFVQLTWLFTLHPQLLEPGRVITLPLALARHVEPWTYEVVARETLQTPVGEIETVHVKPQRPPRPGGDMTAEMWIAPSLQYLPVRITIHTDSENYADLLISRLPMQAPGR